MNLKDELLGESPGIETVRKGIERLLQRSANIRSVLIQGETGSGKGLVARALHRAGPRAGGPFIDVNCAAIPETLLEAEMFGFERGAFTDARQAKPGLFQAAHRGTLFLDEIGALPESLQTKLLKVIEDRTVRRLGSTRSEPVDVWIVTATSVDLLGASRDGTFRADLYHRLAVFTIWLPPLRERGQDIIRLAEHFLARACADHGLPAKELTEDARKSLMGYPWPGNVRELSNALERAALLADERFITATTLALPTSQEAPDPRKPAGARAGAAHPESEQGSISLDDTVRVHVSEVLVQTGWNLSRAAGLLGISRNTLHARIRKYGLEPPAPRPAGRGAGRKQGRPAAPESETVSSMEPKPAPPPASFGWERRLLAFLRVSLSVSPDMSAFQVAPFIDDLIAKVRSFGGQIEQLTPLGAVAMFGVDPIENATSHAAHAALAIVKGVERAQAGKTRSVQTRCALHANWCLIARTGDVIGMEPKDRQAVSAALDRLIQSAEPDTIVVDDAGVQFIRRRLELEPIESGSGAPVGVYRVVGRERTGFEVGGGGLSRFVGREAELELLENRWSLAVQGLGQIVGVVGDPGVGKSRLIWEFVHGGNGHRGLVLETASFALGRPTPYLAIIELLRAYFGLKAGEPDGSIREKVAQRLEDLDPSLAASMPAFLSLLDLPTEDSEWDALDPTRRRQRTLEAIKHLMLHESARQPLLLVFEDGHWADSETKALLETIADSLPVARVLMLVTFRPEYEHGWGHRTFYTQIRVDPLRGDGVQRFLRDLLGDHPSLDSLRGRLIEWTGGNPFFLEETIRTLAETKVLDGERGTYRLIQPATSITVPDTVHEVLAARMARLAPAAHEVLRSAAVVGRRVPHEVLAAVSVSSAETLGQGLEQLQARDFLSDTGLVREREYTFRHALTQDVAYASLPEDQRRALHARILRAMARVYAGRLDDKVAELAHHAFEGQQWQEAVGYLHRAGTRGLARSANTEAATCFEHALVALSHLQDSRENQEQAIDLRFGLRNALTPLGQAHRTLEHLREANRLAGLLGDERRRARALSFAANSLCLVADYEGAIEASQQAHQLATSLGDFPLSVAAGMYLGRASAGLGQYRRAADVLHEVAASLTGERAHDYLGLPVLPAVFSRSQLILALAELGEFDEAERYIKEATEIADVTRHPETLLWAHVAAGTARLVRGQLAPATGALEHAMEIYRAADIPVYFPLVSSPLGLAYAMAGRIPEGLVLVEQAVEQTESKRQAALLAWTLLRLGKVRLLADQPSAAADAASRALALFREHKERGGEAYTSRLLGDIEGRRGDAGGAKLLVVQGYSLAQDLGMKPLAARCQLWLGMLRTPGKPDPDVATHLAASAQALNNLGMDHWARIAEHTQKD